MVFISLSTFETLIKKNRVCWVCEVFVQSILVVEFRFILPDEHIELGRISRHI